MAKISQIQKKAMTQHTNVHQEPHSYTRADFTALRAWVLKIPTATIARLYYSEEAHQLKGGLEKYLVAMRSDLIERAIVANPHLADVLANARRGGPITTTALKILIEAADIRPGTPRQTDPIGMWLRVKTAKQLKEAGLSTLSDLKEHIEANGPTWWTPIPRVGKLRAQAICNWMDRYEALAINPNSQLSVVFDAQALAPLASAPLPLERISSLPSDLDGHNGSNRSPVFSYLTAKNDLEAVRAYIQKFKAQPHTVRAYQRELERFVLWCVLIQGKPLSSALVDDCEAYKLFLEAPSPPFCGPRRGRFSPHWKPFAGPLSPESQKQAIQILRTAMGWLHKVRYLGGNPWAAVGDPRVDQQIRPIQIDRALPGDLYEKVVRLLTASAQETANKQDRVALAALLLLGDCGLRISEASTTRLGQLEPSPFVPGQYRLTVLGKGRKFRAIPLSSRACQALQAHQVDVHERFGQSPGADSALIQPLTLPPTSATNVRHKTTFNNGYTPNALGRLVCKTLQYISDNNEIDVDEMVKLRLTSAHGLRHTFGTMATEREMPLDVVQSILGHASIDTTSIYIRAQEKRVAQEAEKFHNGAGI